MGVVCQDEAIMLCTQKSDSGVWLLLSYSTDVMKVLEEM